MEEVYLRDRGGVQPDASDILSDEVITYLDGINMTLGTEKDPRYNEYKEFLNSIAEASILTIEPEQMSNGKYDDLDLSGESEEDSQLIIPAMKDEEFVQDFSNFITAAVLCSPFNMKNGISYDKEFAPVFEFQFPTFTDA